jgi:hypothetical protein
MYLSIQHARFLELEYLTLRKEIEDSKGRMFKIVAGEAILVPAIQILLEWAGKEGGTLTYLFIPMLVSALVFRFLYENNCMFRAGEYIRTNIESICALPSAGYTGWENWLEMNEINEIGRKNSRFEDIMNFVMCKEFHRRQVDKYVKMGFYVLSLIYYISTVSIAMINLEIVLSNQANSIYIFDESTSDRIISTAILLLYILLGFIMTLMVLGAKTRSVSSSTKKR